MAQPEPNEIWHDRPIGGNFGTRENRAWPGGASRYRPSACPICDTIGRYGSHRQADSGYERVSRVMDFAGPHIRMILERTG